MVNLARRSISPRQFGIDEDTGQLKSVLFQRPVCFIHANAGGVADSTFYLLRTAYYLQADTSAWTGYRVPDELDALQLSGLRADKALQDRVVVDSNLCFGPFAHAPEWRGILSYVYLATPFNEVTFAGLEFFIARPLRSQASRSGGAEMVFDIVDKMPFPLRTRKQTGRAKPPNGTQTWFEARNRFDAQVGGDKLGQTKVFSSATLCLGLAVMLWLSHALSCSGPFWPCSLRPFVYAFIAVTALLFAASNAVT